ncbi:MAG: hypothetical protein ABI986_14420 [Chloroflexota bacterium]
MYLEIININLKSEVTAEDFIEGNRNFEANFMKAQPGLRSRKLGKASDGSWVVVNEWESEAASKASSAAGGSNPSAGALMGMLDMSKMSMQHFEIIEL